MPKAGPATLLVVDDNHAILRWIGEAFEGRYRVLLAENGREGLELARSQHPALILLDIMMPQVTGLEMLQSLLADARTREIPVVLMTASELDGQTERELRGNPNVKGLLVKPCGLETLFATVSAVLH